MSIINTGYLQVIASWPLIPDELDLTQPSPWRSSNITIPPDTSPLRPTLAILLSRSIANQIYASDGALSNYVFLTSVNDPTEPNITTFANVHFNPSTNLLYFQPAVDLTPGARYQATLRSNVPDINGRLIERSYSWEFIVNSSTNQGLPIPILLSPADQSMVVTTPITFSWGIPSTYTPPSGSSVFYNVKVYTDRGLTAPIWSGSIAAADPTGSGAYAVTQVVPAFSVDTLKSPQLYYWSVQTRVDDSQGNTIAVSRPSPYGSFLLDVPGDVFSPPEGGPGGNVWPPLLQTDPFVPAQAFRVVLVSPQPGLVCQDESAFVLD